MNTGVKNIIVASMWGMMGRRNLARLARFLNNEVRLDVTNDMASNGERLVQKVALAIAASSDAPGVIFDAGANVGDWTCSLMQTAAATKASNLEIHSFEPCLATYETLCRNIARFSNACHVVPVQEALSNEQGRAQLHVIGDGVGTNSLHPHADLTFAREETIMLTTVDDYCRDNRIDHLVALKIDTEGHDLLVMQGARGMLDRRAIDLVQFEYNYRWISARSFLRDAFVLLQSCGYHIGKITPKGIEFYRGWHYELESFREANYLACKEQFIESFPVIPWWND